MLKPKNSTQNEAFPPLSVLMVIQTFYPIIGGAEKQCLQVAKTLKERGHRVEVLTERWAGWPDEKEVEGIPVHRVGRGGPRRIHSIWFMMEILFNLLLRARHYDVFHAHLAASHAVATAFVGKLLKKKVIVKIGGGTIIGEIALSRKTFFGRLKLRALGWLKPQFVVLNEDQKKELKGFGLERVPVTLIPNGVDLNRYYPLSNEHKNELRSKLGWKGTVFLFVGRFSKDKIPVSIFENLILSWKTLYAANPSVSFYLIGNGPLVQDYRNMIQKHEIGRSIHLVEARDHIVEFYQAADIFVLPSITEGLSNALLEAMSSSLPVLGSRIPGIMELVEPGQHGYLFDPYSINEIKKCLSNVTSNSEKLKAIGSRCRKKAFSYSIHNTVDHYIDLYING